MKILIGGNTGFIGVYLSRLLESKGHEVIGLSRQAAPKSITWNDLHSKGLPKGCNAVVNLAGENLMNPMKRWNEDFKDSLRSSRIDSTKQLTQAICQASEPPKVFVSSSAVGYYPASQSEQYTEDSLPPNKDFMTELCHDWENSAKLPGNHPTRRATVRIGIVLGREGGTISNLFLPFYMGVGGPVASGKQWFPWIHVRDVAGIFAHAIENENVHGTLNAVAPNTNTNAEFTKAFASALWRPAFFPVPKFALNLIYGETRAEVITEGQQVIPKRTLESGYKFVYPDLQSACKEFSRLFPGVSSF